jgi:hypothetical protein
MKIHFHKYLLIAVLLIYSCSEKKPDYNNEIQIINQVFLGAVDTTAYNYTSLRPALLDSIKKEDRNANPIPITIYYKLENIQKWRQNILAELNAVDSFPFKDNFKHLYASFSGDTMELAFNVQDLKNTGRYQLVENMQKDIQRKDSVAGHVKFSRVIYDQNFGLLVATIQDNIKSGVTKLFFLKKEKNEWKIIKESIIEIW